MTERNNLDRMAVPQPRRYPKCKSDTNPYTRTSPAGMKFSVPTEFVEFHRRENTTLTNTPFEEENQ
jgi:hypothetical protein